MILAASSTDGLRERKRYETERRIVETSLPLFIERGFDGVTIDELAAAAGISRRTFFHYFPSKEDVLLSMHSDRINSSIGPMMLEESPDQTPLQAAYNCLCRLTSSFESKQSVAIDRLFQSTESLRSRKEMAHIEMERALLKAMTELWPDPNLYAQLRTSAMIAMGALRLALDDMREDDGNHPLDYHLQKIYASLGTANGIGKPSETDCGPKNPE